MSSRSISSELEHHPNKMVRYAVLKAQWRGTNEMGDNTKVLHMTSCLVKFGELYTSLDPGATTTPLVEKMIRTEINLLIRSIATFVPPGPDYDKIMAMAETLMNDEPINHDNQVECLK